MDFPTKSRLIIQFQKGSWTIVVGSVNDILLEDHKMTLSIEIHFESFNIIGSVNENSSHSVEDASGR